MVAADNSMFYAELFYRHIIGKRLGDKNHVLITMPKHSHWEAGPKNKQLGQRGLCPHKWVKEATEEGGSYSRSWHFTRVSLAALEILPSWAPLPLYLSPWNKAL